MRSLIELINILRLWYKWITFEISNNNLRAYLYEHLEHNYVEMLHYRVYEGTDFFYVFNDLI